MRWILTIAGALAALVGVFWILQGVGIVPVGFMSGQIRWAINGAIAAVLGLGLIAFANWPRRKTPPNG
jgi:hypothetical protein